MIAMLMDPGFWLSLLSVTLIQVEGLSVAEAALRAGVSAGAKHQLSIPAREA